MYQWWKFLHLQHNFNAQSDHLALGDIKPLVEQESIRVIFFFLCFRDFGEAWERSPAQTKAKAKELALLPPPIQATKMRIDTWRWGSTMTVAPVSIPRSRIHQSKTDVSTEKVHSTCKNSYPAQLHKGTGVSINTNSSVHFRARMISGQCRLLDGRCPCMNNAFTFWWSHWILFDLTNWTMAGCSLCVRWKKHGGWLINNLKTWGSFLIQSYWDFWHICHGHILGHRRPMGVPSRVRCHQAILVKNWTISSAGNIWKCRRAMASGSLQAKIAQTSAMC